MQENTKSQSNQSANAQLQSLIDEANSVVEEIDEITNDSVAQLNEIDSQVNESITKIEKICSELDQIEKEASDEIDELILQQAEVLAEE